MLRRDPLIPPRRLQRYGRGDFAEAGEAHLACLRELARLGPADRVLEVGCGTGRLARPLVRFLEEGTYDGLDVDREAIGWCRRAYRRHGNARFLRADVFDPREHPGGAHRGDEYCLPYPDASFDVAVMLGVLSHLLEAEAARHLEELGRVLAPGGRVLATLFVLDGDSRARMADGRAALSFLDAEQPVALLSEDLPEEGVAYDAAWLRERLGAGGCELATVERGSWRGREQARDLLDVMVGVRA